MGEKRGQMTKNFLNFKKFPQTASERLDLFSCLGETYTIIVIDNNPRKSYTTIIYYLGKQSYTILNNHVRPTYTTIIDNLRHLN